MIDGTASTPTQRVKRPAFDLEAGTIVGDYQIESTLGRGGMGVVYRAVQPVIGKRVALKVIHHDLCEDEAGVTRFVKEARAVNRIGHPNIVDVFGFGTTPDGRAFLAMELLDGVSLKHRIERGPPLDCAEICDILVEVTHALEAAHRAGIVHRDLKPDNVFLIAQARGGGAVKLLDFGIAKLSSIGGFGEPVDCTQPGTLVGTPRYMAPEQARGLPVDGSADVYSLGVVAFELFTGRPPFASSDSIELLAKHITLRPPAPSALDATLPKLVDDVIGAMLEKQPAHRPSLAAIRDVLVQVRTTKPTRHTRAQSPTQILDGDPPKRRRWWLLGPAVVAVSALVLVLVRTIDRSDGPAATRQAPEAVQTPPASPATVGSAAPLQPVPPALATAPSAVPASAPVPTTSRVPAVRKRHVTSKRAPKLISTPVTTAPQPPAANVHPALPADDALRNPFERKR